MEARVTWDFMGFLEWCRDRLCRSDARENVYELIFWEKTRAFKPLPFLPSVALFLAILYPLLVIKPRREFINFILTRINCICIKMSSWHEAC